MAEEPRNTHRIVLACSLVIACLMTLVMIAGIAMLWDMRERATVSPTPQETSSVQEADDGLPWLTVDWAYWKRTNPDIVGWISIPGTPISYPLAQARADAPQHYLTHDVFGAWNYMGCPYIDASCDQGGFTNVNYVVYGHNLGWDDQAMFAPLACYTDEAFAQAHRLILIQTPEGNRAFRVDGARVVEGSLDAKRTAFDSQEDFATYRRAMLDACTVRMADAPAATSLMLTLCTCSYTRFQNERTLVFASPET